MKNSQLKSLMLLPLCVGSFLWCYFPDPTRFEPFMYFPLYVFLREIIILWAAFPALVYRALLITKQPVVWSKMAEGKYPKPV